MRRASKPRVWLSALLVTVACLGASRAFAQTCESARPTEASGTTGMTYGNAEVTFYDSASGRARIHYALAGTHAPPAASTLEDGVPDAVVVAAEAAEAALDKFGALGYRAPLSDADSPCSSNGDSDAVDVYLLNFAAADGQAVPDACEAGLPRRCSGYIVVENDFKRGGYANTAEGLRTVVPHELFHLVQNAYDADVERWWAEGSAQWADKQVYPELKDLERFLPDYFESPWRPLNVPPNGVITNFLYATAIWPVFLGERFDAELVREVYEGLGPDADVLPATDAALQKRGSSLAEEFLQFAAYNAATGKRAPDSGGYVDAASYPLVSLKALTSSDGELVSEVGSGLGAFYYSLDAQTPLELSLEADRAREAALLVPLVDGRPRLDAAKPLPATLEGPGIVVVAGQSLLRTDAPFTLRGKAPSSEPGGGGDEPDSSGCSLARPPRQGAGFGSVALGFVISLLGRWRARKRHERPCPCV
ncbi:MAG TPA: MXAN_6640 family putative metalloprotease [Polyangiaceae bacterium]|nr:MXAN_6640 family putative metalloprotease [Polyangiaceae bacterium]